jgi:ABC-type nitrate/sulfonate/bicarbonate transport system ATPase subunit
VIFITHDVEEALYLGDRVIVLSARPGRVVRALKVELPRPRRQGMIAQPEFGRQVKELLEALKVDI